MVRDIVRGFGLGVVGILTFLLTLGLIWHFLAPIGTKIVLTWP